MDIDTKLNHALGFVNVLTKTKGLFRGSLEMFRQKIENTKKNQSIKSLWQKVN